MRLLLPLFYSFMTIGLLLFGGLSENPGEIDNESTNSSYYQSYCDYTQTYNDSRYINDFSTSGAEINISNLGSGYSTDGYEDATDQAVSQYAGGDVSFSASFDGGSEGFAIWVDWNQDFEFQDSEKVYTSDGYVNPATGTFSVPTDAENGDYRMRIVGDWLSQNPSACGDNTNGGEAEDYTFTVVDPPSCVKPTDLEIVSTTSTSADVSWTEIGDADEWEVVYGPVGFDVENGTSVTDDDNDLGVTIDGLDPQTEYDVYVRAICSSTDQSNYTGPVSFFTDCATFDLPFFEDFADDATPQCWTESGDNAWDYSTGAGYAASDVEDHTLGSDTNYAWMDGSDNEDGNVSSLTSPLVDISSLTDPAVEFYLFSNNTDDAAINEIKIELYDGADWNELENITSLLGEGWNQYVVDLSTYNITGDVKIRFTVTGQANGGDAYYHDILLDDVKFLELPDCTNPEANYEVVSDCDNGQQFLVDVDVTDLGGDDDVVISDNQGNSETVSSAGVTTFGPYDNGTDVSMTLENAEDSNCAIMSGNLTQEYCSEVTVDCSAGAIDDSFCYGNNETLEVTYTSSDGNSLNLNINSGEIESFDDFIVLDTDGTELYNGTGADGDLSNIGPFQSTGDEITVQVVGDISISCEDPPTGGAYDPIDLTVGCATCANPSVDYTVIEDCMNGPQFKIEADVTDLGSATDIDISDDQGGDVETVSSTGTVTFGPYDNGTDVIITAENNQDANCVVSSAALTQEDCDVTYIDCDDGPVTTTFCYDDSEVFEKEFASTDGSPLTVQITGGSVEDDSDLFTVKDSDGSNLYSGYGDGGDLSGLSFQSTGDNLSFEVDASFFNSCAGGQQDPIEVTVFCSTCTFPEYSITKSCDPNANQFSVDVEITDLGSADMLTLQGDQGLPAQDVNSTGVYSFGPYDYNNDVQFTLTNEQDDNCTITTPAVSSDECPPIPCLEAEPFCSNEGLTFENGSEDPSGSDGAPEGINYGCLLSTPNPVWYFLQIEESGGLSINIEQNTDFDDDGNATGTGLDVDFIAWGPFDSVDEGCNGLTIGNQVSDNAFGDGCSYSASDQETFGIEDAEEGDVYVLLLTNYSGDPGSIQLNQTAGDGSTDCSIINSNDIYTCSEDTTLTSPYDNAITYQWYNFDREDDTLGTVIDDELDPDLTVDESGSYASVTFANDGSKNDVEVFNVVIGDAPAADVPEQVSLCGTNTVQLEAEVQDTADYGAIEYQWFQGDEVIADADTSFVEVNETGTYQVQISGELLSLDGEPSGNYCDTTYTVEVNTADYDLDLGPDQELCDQDNYTITSEVTGEDMSNLNFTWFDQDGEIDGETESELTVGETGTYVLSTEYQGCVAEDTIEVVFNDSPEFNLGEDIELCDLTTANIDATPANFDVSEVTYTWSYEGTEIPETGAVIAIEDYGYGTYEVTAFINSEDCATTQTIQVGERSDIKVELKTDDSDNILCIDEDITLTANLSNATEDEVEFAWFKNNTLIDGETGSSLTVTADGNLDNDVYAVEVTLGNCFDDAESAINLYDNEECIITEGLSPNTTPGENDCLDLTFLNDRTGINGITIYNRYGREVYSKSNYTDSWCGQDGNGDLVSTGTYYYVIDIAGDDPVFGSVKKGWIYVNRDTN